MPKEDPQKGLLGAATQLVVNEISGTCGRSSHIRCWKGCPHSNPEVRKNSELNDDSERILRRKGCKVRPLAYSKPSDPLLPVQANISDFQGPSRLVLYLV